MNLKHLSNYTVVFMNEVISVFGDLHVFGYNFLRLTADMAEWSDKTFGLANWMSCLNHLESEINEVRADPANIEEWADCCMLVIDGARQCGHSLPALLAACKRKHEINKGRRWVPDERGFYHHAED